MSASFLASYTDIHVSADCPTFPLMSRHCRAAGSNCMIRFSRNPGSLPRAPVSPGQLLGLTSITPGTIQSTFRFESHVHPTKSGCFGCTCPAAPQ